MYQAGVMIHVLITVLAWRMSSSEIAQLHSEKKKTIEGRDMTQRLKY